MKLKNISGSTLSVSVDGKCVTMANNTTATFPDTAQAQTDAKNWITREYLELVDASDGAEFAQSVDVEDSVLLTATGQPSDTETVTINGVIFEFDTGGVITAGNVLVTIGGNVNVTYASLAAAINANTTLKALNVKATDQVNIGTGASRVKVAGLGTTAITQAEGVTGLAISAVAAVANEGYRQVIKSVTATGATVLFDTGLTSVVAVIVQVRNAVGRIKLYDGVVQIGGGLVFLSDDTDLAGGANTTDIANTDVVTISAIGK